MSYIARVLGASCATLLFSCVAFGDPLPRASPLTLLEALRVANGQSPRLVEADAMLAGERGRLGQARLRPNPDIAFDAENFAGTGPFSGVRATEFTGTLGVPIELGGKRAARIAAGTTGVGAARARRALSGLDLELAVRQAYARALAADAVVALVRDEQTIAVAIADAAGKLVASGREPPLRQVRADAERASATVAVAAAEQDAQVARRDLQLLIAGDGSLPPLDDASLFAPPQAASPAAGALPDLDVARLDAERARRLLRVERAARTPDPRVYIGVRRLQGDNATALVGGVSIPLPLFNRNGGGVAAASAAIVGAEATLMRTRAETATRALDARDRIAGARAQLATIEQSLLPSAVEGLRIARLGYVAGKFGYLELLDAQRAFALARRQRIDAARDYHLAQAELDRALGRTLTPETPR